MKLIFLSTFDLKLFYFTLFSNAVSLVCQRILFPICRFSFPLELKMSITMIHWYQLFPIYLPLLLDLKYWGFHLLILCFLWKIWIFLCSTNTIDTNKQQQTEWKEFHNYGAGMEKLTKINANERNYNSKWKNHMFHQL